MFIATRTGLMAQKVAAAPVVSDVFATSLYTGNSAQQTITNGINLSGKGGLVWVKGRTNGENHAIVDTARGTSHGLRTDTSDPSLDSAGFTSFNSNGFSFGSAFGARNALSITYAAWTFRKAARFFDVQTKSHTTGSPSTVDLSALGTVGMVVVKRTDSTGDWYVWHRSLSSGYNILLNGVAAHFNANAYLSVSGTTLTIASGMPTGTYIVYAWAHDSGSFVQCGSYTGNGSTTGPTVSLGWEPQYILIKNTASSSWVVYDSARGINNSGTDAYLFPNASDAEGQFDGLKTSSTGFQLTSASSSSNANANTHIYMAIKKAG